MGFFVAAGALGQLLLEALLLLHGVVELAEGVADLKAADEDLEALDPVGVVGLLLGERRDGGWEVVDDGGLDEVLFGDGLEDARDRPAGRLALLVVDVLAGRAQVFVPAFELFGVPKLFQRGARSCPLFPATI